MGSFEDSSLAAQDAPDETEAQYGGDDGCRQGCGVFEVSSSISSGVAFVFYFGGIASTYKDSLLLRLTGRVAWVVLFAYLLHLRLRLSSNFSTILSKDVFCSLSRKERTSLRISCMMELIWGLIRLLMSRISS